MKYFEPHWEALPPAQREFWPQLAASTEIGLVLYGGTAVALRLGHRVSVDFDFFTEKPLNREELSGRFGFLASSTVIQSQKNTLTVLAPVKDSSVKISFSGEISIGRAGTPDRTPDQIVEVASFEDLLATKLKVIQQRIEAKDYRDVAAMLRAGIRLETGLAAARALYGPAFQPSEALKALTYFEGGDLVTLTAAEREILTRAAAVVRQIPFVGLASQSLSSRQA